MKKIAAFFAAVFLVFALCPMAFMVGGQVSVLLDGNALEFDAVPFIEDGRTMVPMRGIFEAVGADVAWDEDTKTVLAVRTKGQETSVVSLQIDADYAFVNGEKKVLDVPAKIVGDRTFVPLRFIAEALGETVEWNADTASVNIRTQGGDAK
ncbi:MAG: copper amine oxidase N-terminal domain-containing protein [Clostridia bacterium]|nr:copper amine oxidase N-terminal domain-containing protein [Clostridia bacterium]